MGAEQEKHLSREELQRQLALYESALNLLTTQQAEARAPYDGIRSWDPTFIGVSPEGMHLGVRITNLKREIARLKKELGIN